MYGEYGWDEEDVLDSIPREDSDSRIEDIEVDFSLESDLIEDDDYIASLYDEYIKILLEE